MVKKKAARIPRAKKNAKGTVPAGVPATVTKAQSVKRRVGPASS